MLDVRLQDLVGHIASCGAEVTPRPEMSAPELLVQPPEVPKQVVRRFALDGLHNATRRQVRGCVHEEMNMIGTHVPFQDFDVCAPTDLRDQIAASLTYIAPQGRLAVLRNEYEMVVNSGDCV